LAQPADVPYCGDLFDKWRQEEALGLQREDVGLAASTSGIIRVQAKTVNGESRQPKTKVNRAVPVSRALRAYPDSYTPRPSFGDWHFPSPHGQPLRCGQLQSGPPRRNQKAGLPWTCLIYRHTFGSQLAMKGESLHKSATLMGNSAEICRRHYAALTPESMTNTVEFSSTFGTSKTAAATAPM
jgi:integrase